MKPAQKPTIEVLLAELEALKRERDSLQEEVLKHAELSKSQAFLDSLIENIPNMVFVKDAKDLRFVRFNRAGEELLGHQRSDLIGKNDYDFFPKEQAEFFIAKDRAVLGGREIVDIPEELISTRLKGQRILHTRKIPILGASGEPEYLLGISEDITEAKKVEQTRASMIREQGALEARELAHRKDAFLAQASTLLASSLNYRETLERLASLTVPVFGDWCTIIMLKEDRSLERVAAIHKNPKKAPLIDELAKYQPPNQDESTGIGYVIRTGKSFFTPLVPDSDLVAAAQNERHLSAMRELGCVSSMLVPIVARGKVHGAIAFVSGASGRHFDSQDLAIAEEVGKRAGIAVDNALLFEAAQKAIDIRDEFLSIASHELKTPITSLKLQIQMTRKKLNPGSGLPLSAEKLAQVFDVSNAQINRLTALVDDLLDVSRIQSGKLTYHFEQVDLSELVREMGERFIDQLQAAGCELKLTADQPVLACCDRFRMEQVIVNLLTNAAKYGAEKPVEVSVARAGKVARIMVRDQGIGIPEEKLEKIFERFERAVSSSNISGLGLGLYITREIVTAHQGTVRARSRLGEGSVFTVELPLT